VLVVLDEGVNVQSKVNTPDQLLVHILDAAVCMKKRENQLRRTTHDLRTRVH